LHRQLVQISVQKGEDALRRGSVALHSAGLTGSPVWIWFEQEVTESPRVVYRRKQ
jgi:hypothetical protein